MDVNSESLNEAGDQKMEVAHQIKESLDSEESSEYENNTPVKEECNVEPFGKDDIPEVADEDQGIPVSLTMDNAQGNPNLEEREIQENDGELNLDTPSIGIKEVSLSDASGNVFVVSDMTEALEDLEFSEEVMEPMSGAPSFMKTRVYANKRQHSSSKPKSQSLSSNRERNGSGSSNQSITKYRKLEEEVSSSELKDIINIGPREKQVGFFLKNTLNQKFGRAFYRDGVFLDAFLYPNMENHDVNDSKGFLCVKAHGYILVEVSEKIENWWSHHPHEMMVSIASDMATLKKLLELIYNGQAFLNQEESELFHILLERLRIDYCYRYGFDDRPRDHSGIRPAEWKLISLEKSTVMTAKEAPGGKYSSIVSSKLDRYPLYPDDITEKIFDTHCHLNEIFDLKELSWDWDEYKKRRARELGKTFSGCINVLHRPFEWTDEARSNQIEADDVYLAYGCHPSRAVSYNSENEELLRKCLKNEKVVALGEIGLDATHIRDNNTLEVQKEVFLKQLKLAQELKLPIILHIREAESEALAVILKSGLPKYWKMHFHCFTQTFSVCMEWMRQFPNMKFGFVPDKFDLTTAREIPITKILLETDAPYFTPFKCQENSGYKRGHPGLVYHVAAKIGILRRANTDFILKRTCDNAKEFYNIDI